MKKLFLLAIILLLNVSCSKEDTEVNFSTNISQTSDEIIVNDTSLRLANNGDFITEFIVDLDNEDTHDYLSKLEDLNLENVRLKFQGLTGLDGNQTPTNLKITFNNQVEINLNNFVYDNVANGQEFRLTETQKIKEAARLLLSNKHLSIKIEGHIPDAATYNFFITFLAKANITAQAL